MNKTDFIKQLDLLKEQLGEESQDLLTPLYNFANKESTTIEDILGWDNETVYYSPSWGNSKYMIYQGEIYVEDDKGKWTKSYSKLKTDSILSFRSFIKAETEVVNCDLVVEKGDIEFLKKQYPTIFTRVEVE